MMPRLTTRLAACAILALAATANAGAEASPAAPAVASPGTVASPAAAPVEDWVAPEDIADRADTAARLIEAAVSDEATAALLARVQQGLDEADPALGEALSNAEGAIRDRSSLMAIQDARRQIEGASENLQAWHAEITTEAKRLAELLEKLGLATQLWARTLARPETTQAGDAVVRRVNRSLVQIDEATARLRELRVRVLAVSDRLMERNTSVRESLANLEEATRDQGTALLVPSHPPLWARGLEGSLPAEWSRVPQQRDEFQESTRAYLDLDARPFLLQGLIAVVLMLLFRHLPQRVQIREALTPMSESPPRSVPPVPASQHRGTEEDEPRLPVLQQLGLHRPHARAGQRPGGFPVGRLRPGRQRQLGAPVGPLPDAARRAVGPDGLELHPRQEQGRDGTRRRPSNCSARPPSSWRLGGGFQAYFTQKRDGSIRDERMPVMAEVAKFCRERQAICHHATQVPQVAVLFSTAAHYRQSQTASSPATWPGSTAPCRPCWRASSRSRSRASTI